MAQWKVNLRKHGATWYYFTENPVGGGFGSNYCGPQYVALARATQNIPDGASYLLTINERPRGLVVRGQERAKEVR